MLYSKKTKFVSLLLVLVMCLSFAPLQVLADEGDDSYTGTYTAMICLK